MHYVGVHRVATLRPRRTGRLLEASRPAGWDSFLVQTSGRRGAGREGELFCGTSHGLDTRKSRVPIAERYS